MLQERNSQIIFKAIILPPVEGEVRKYKDGDYKFVDGHWQKIKQQEETKNNEPKIELYEKPDMEYPVYKVTIGDAEYFIQRYEEVNSPATWTKVNKDERGTWQAELMGTGPGYKYAKYLGDTKQEAVKNLILEHNEKTSLQDFPDYYNEKIEKEILTYIGLENEINIEKEKSQQYPKGYRLFAEAFEKEILENKTTPVKLMVDLLGGIKDPNIKIKYFTIKRSQKGCRLYLETNKFTHSREIDLVNKNLESGLIDTINVDEKSPGIAHKMFIHCINTSIKFKLNNFKIEAGGDYSSKINPKKEQKLNGYEHWGKLGFEIDSRFEGNYNLFKSTLKGTKYENCKGILDLYAEEGGYDFWVKNGFSIRMKFDFKDKKQLAILNEYNNNYIKKYGL